MAIYMICIQKLTTVGDCPVKVFNPFLWKQIDCENCKNKLEEFVL